jgi:hypothetical protein
VLLRVAFSSHVDNVRVAGTECAPAPPRKAKLEQRVLQPMDRLEQLGRFLLRGLRIGASTVSIVELLGQDWTGGISAALAWLVFLQVERRLPPRDPGSEG